jgi:hypothetical protein
MAAVSDVDFDVAAFAMQVAMMSQEHASRPPSDAARRSRLALAKWGERIPAALSPAAQVRPLLDRHGDAWLRDSEHFSRAIDPGLRGSGIHVADYETLEVESPAGSAFCFPYGIFAVVQDKLPAGALPGHVVAVNLPAHVEAVLDRLAHADEAVIVDAVRVSLCGTLAHEIAHLAENDANGKRIPDGVTSDIFRQAVAAPATADNTAAVHGPGWIRGLAHATYRAERLEPRFESFWWKIFRDDAKRHTAACVGDLFDALADELDQIDTPLAHILRRPTPPAFLQLSESRGLTA